MKRKLIADSGATKCEWCLVGDGKTTTVFTQGISPYFLSLTQIVSLLQKELLPFLEDKEIHEVFYYGTGLSNPDNVITIKAALKQLFADASIEAHTDLLAAARALCIKQKGVACILGTGSNSCYFDGKEVIKNSPGIGYVLGDEGSGAYLGKKVIQYFMYNTFDEDLRARFDFKFQTNGNEILENVYKQPLPNRYLASFAIFLAENRGHYMIENILEDGLNDFFFTHLSKYNESWKFPVHFVGGISFAFKDVLAELCNSYGFDTGTILQNPMQGLTIYHRDDNDQ
ncbi:N-acetylglucosamine kinase [Segetibacter sp. 3557_3]|uniref:N-acetylglucosamine kinase n=1 Tax=Segetibacter sp. 3557_3 TaxID=2547429 RepID=UPI001058655B|nr:N-acetylglucosamine kinase [Segetibacter sp. 3557_3]TDH21393.1 N-acetylglucosamine kinase [Segetibacter sp. 3557_3]